MRGDSGIGEFGAEAGEGCCGLTCMLWSDLYSRLLDYRFSVVETTFRRNISKYGEAMIFLSCGEKAFEVVVLSFFPG
jgi:hypothetical protein